MTIETHEAARADEKPPIESGIFEGSSFPDRIGTYPNGQDQMVWDRKGARVRLDEAALSVDVVAGSAFHAVAYELADGTVLAYTENRQFTITQNPDGSKSVTTRERHDERGEVKKGKAIPAEVTVGETPTKYGVVKRVSVFSSFTLPDAISDVSQGRKLLYGRGGNSSSLERELTKPTKEIDTPSDVLLGIHYGDEKLTIEENELGHNALAEAGLVVSREY